MQPGLLNPKFVSPGWLTEASAAEGSCYAMFAAEAARIPAAARRVGMRLLCISPSRTAVRFAKLVQTTLSTCRVAVYGNVDPTAVCVSCARKSSILRGTEPEQLRAHFEAARVVLWSFARHTVYAQL